MMKLTIAFALLATASAINSCPSNSVQTKFPYTDMRSCKCNKGYQAYPYPGWGAPQRRLHGCALGCHRHLVVQDAGCLSWMAASSPCLSLSGHSKLCVSAT